MVKKQGKWPKRPDPTGSDPRVKELESKLEELKRIGDRIKEEVTAGCALFSFFFHVSWMDRVLFLFGNHANLIFSDTVQPRVLCFFSLLCMSNSSPLGLERLGCQPLLSPAMVFPLRENAQSTLPYRCRNVFLFFSAKPTRSSPAFVPPSRRPCSKQVLAVVEPFAAENEKGMEYLTTSFPGGVHLSG